MDHVIEVTVSVDSWQSGMLITFSAALTDSREMALQNAREAYRAERFGDARNLASSASQTDRKNPDDSISHPGGPIRRSQTRARLFMCRYLNQ